MEVREEMAGLEGALAAVKHDYELLRMEYERMMASNEQAGPIAAELRVTVDSLQKSISQHKSEANRYKTRMHKAEQQVTKVMHATHANVHTLGRVYTCITHSDHTLGVDNMCDSH